MNTPPSPQRHPDAAALLALRQPKTCWPMAVAIAMPRVRAICHWRNRAFRCCDVAGIGVLVSCGGDGGGAAGGAVLSSLVAIQIKQLTRVDSADTVVLYTYVFWVPLSLVPALFVWVWPSGMAWLWLLATGVLGTVGQLLWTRALRLGEVSALTPISFLQLPLVTLFGWLLFNETVDRWTIIGAASSSPPTPTSPTAKPCCHAALQARRLCSGQARRVDRRHAWMTLHSSVEPSLRSAALRASTVD